MKKMISRRNFLKVCAVAGSAVALSACGGSKKPAAPDPSNTDQTSFDIVGGQSALSPGYNDNEVLKKRRHQDELRDHERLPQRTGEHPHCR